MPIRLPEGVRRSCHATPGRDGCREPTSWREGSDVPAANQRRRQTLSVPADRVNRTKGSPPWLRDRGQQLAVEGWTIYGRRTSR